MGFRHYRHGAEEFFSATYMDRFLLLKLWTGEVVASVQLLRPCGDWCDVSFASEELVYVADGWRRVQIVDLRTGLARETIAVTEATRVRCGDGMQVVVTSDSFGPGYVISRSPARKTVVRDLGDLDGASIPSDRSWLSVAANHAAGQYHRVDLSSGQVEKRDLPRRLKICGMYLNETEGLIVVDYFEGPIECYDSGLKAVRWTRYLDDGGLRMWSSWTGDGQFFVIGTDKEKVHVLEAATGATRAVYAASFMPRYPVSGARVMDGSVQIMDVTTGAIDDHRYTVDWWRKYGMFDARNWGGE